MTRTITIHCAECCGQGRAWRAEAHAYEPCPACTDGTRTLEAGPGLFAWLGGVKTPQELLVRLNASISEADCRASRAKEIGCRDDELVATVEAATLEAVRNALALVLGQPLAALMRDWRKPEAVPVGARTFKV